MKSTLQVFNFQRWLPSVTDGGGEVKSRGGVESRDKDNDLDRIGGVEHEDPLGSRLRDLPAFGTADADTKRERDSTLLT